MKKVLPDNNYQAFFEKLKNDPVLYFDEILGFDTWSKQKEIAYSVRDNRRTVVKGCHGFGKTALAAAVVTWFYYTYYPAMIITTAPTGHQVKDLLWKEIRNFHRKSKVPLGGECLTTQIKWPLQRNAMGRMEYDAEATALGFSTDKPESFEGAHNVNILLVLDESKGIEKELWTSFDGMMTNYGAKLLSISTPSDEQTEFGKCFWKYRHLYNAISVSYFETPWETGEWSKEKIIKKGLVSDIYESTIRDKYGIESPEYKNRVLGELVSSNPRQMISLSDCEKCREIEGEPGQKKISVDVARFGDDSTTIIEWEGEIIVSIDRYHGLDNNEVASKIIEKVGTPEQAKNYIINIEGGSINVGVIDILRAKGYKVNEVILNSKPSEIEFKNLRAELFWALREQIKGLRISFKRLTKGIYDLMVEDLTSITYGYDGDSKKFIEKKDKIKKKLGRSPDNADALMVGKDKSGAISLDEVRDRLRRKEKELKRNSDFGLG